MLVSPAFAQDAAGAAGGTAAVVMQILPLVLIFAVFYFLLIRPQQKKQREHRELLQKLKRGDRVVIPSTVCCGNCSYCRAGYTAQCDDANPNGPAAGTVFFGGPEQAGGLDGLQAEYARVPFAYDSLIKLPESVTDDRRS